jgi:hypothetical protein
MRDPVGAVRLSMALVWQQFRAKGAGRVFAVPLSYSVLFLGIVVLTARSPEFLTPATRAAVEQATELYFGGADGKYVYALALFVIQGPYYLGMFAGIIGVQSGQGLSAAQIRSGRLELLLSAPFAVKDVFLGLLAGSFLLTMVQIGVFGLVSIGGPILFVALQGGLPSSSLGGVVALGFLVPIPLAIWSNLTVVCGALGLGSDLYEGIDEYLPIVGLAPGIVLVLVVTLLPSVDVLALAGGSLVVSVLATLAGVWWVSNWFDVERVLATT